MRSFLERILVHYPGVTRRCSELAATWVAAEAATLGEGQTLRRSEDDILPGLAQAVREYGVDLAEMARECGIDPIDLRRKLALSRFGELLRPGETWRLTDHALEFKLQLAAQEYGLEVEQLLDEISHPCTETPSTGRSLTVRSKAAKIAWPLRCWICRRLRPQPYRIDFAPSKVGEIRFLPEPAYACHHCLPTHLADQQVQRITRLSGAEIPNSAGVRIRSAAFAAVAILVFSSWYIRGSASSHETRMHKLSATPAPEQFATEIAPASEDGPLPETSHADPPANVPVPVQDSPISPPIAAPAAAANGSQASGDLSRRREAIAAASVATPSKIASAEDTQRVPDRSVQKPVDRATALNDCREVLHNEKPLLRYSVRDAAQDAAQQRVSLAEACAKTAVSLTQLGNECAGLFNWFEAFQSKLTRHVDRVCRKVAEKGATP
jgi:hypothetical protein